MAKSTISESMPTVAPRDQIVPDTPLAENLLVPKPRAASKAGTCARDSPLIALRRCCSAA
jgi:hypothetical protein